MRRPLSAATVGVTLCAAALRDPLPARLPWEMVLAALAAAALSKIGCGLVWTQVRAALALACHAGGAGVARGCLARMAAGRAAAQERTSRDTRAARPLPGTSHQQPSGLVPAHRPSSCMRKYKPPLAASDRGERGGGGCLQLCPLRAWSEGAVCGGLLPWFDDVAGSGTAAADFAALMVVAAHRAAVQVSISPFSLSLSLSLYLSLSLPLSLSLRHKPSVPRSLTDRLVT